MRAPPADAEAGVRDAGRRPARLAALYAVALIVTHATVDAGAGAKPALVQFFRAQLGLSYTVLGAIVTASALGGAVAQVLFGLLADARRRPWTAAAGGALAALGLSLTGFVTSATAAALALGLVALGSAMFHPEALRTMHRLGGERRATAMSYFTVGGSVGWALGPALVGAIAGTFGLAGMRWWIAGALPVAAALWLASARVLPFAATRAGADAADSADRWGDYRTLFAVVLLRAAAHQSLTVFYPAYLIDVAGMSRTVASLSLSLLLVSGIVAGPVIGRLADRWSRRGVLVATVAAFCLLTLTLPVLRGPVMWAVLFLVGSASMGSVPITLVMSQEYLPRRTGLGGGLVLAASGTASLAATPFGVLADGAGLGAVIYACAAVAALAAVVALRLPADAPQARRVMVAALGD
ncbi:MAG: MFS transporter [Armatimonadota bacterium]|nr:MFS transporter [Armatimonadota bacterium]MDR7535546.1 MFS transporter [Armatimonadota bacterium]